MTKLLAILFLLFVFSCDANEAENANGSDSDEKGDSSSRADSSTSIDMDSDPVSDTDTVSDIIPSEDCFSDTCRFENGIECVCQQRFMYGINYAWKEFSADFGGISAWGLPGVNSSPASYAGDLADMKNHGVNVVRWWIFPDFRGDGVSFDGNELPTGLGQSTILDITKALELAEQEDVYLMLTLFSFDGFRPSGDNHSGLFTPSLSPMAKDPAKRALLISNVVEPIAAAVEASPYRHRMVAWDVINEPEWAVSGASLYGGDEDFTPNNDLESLSHAEMEQFLADVITALRANSRALINIGSASRKWIHAWQNLDVDFYQIHMYSWINTWLPYNDALSSFAIDDKPVLMGEYFAGGMDDVDKKGKTVGFISYSQQVDAYYQNGYAGSLAWQYNEASPQQMDDIKTFADNHLCQTQYGSPQNTTSPRTSTALKKTLPQQHSKRICRVTVNGAVCK